MQSHLSFVQENKQMGKFVLGFIVWQVFWGVFSHLIIIALLSLQEAVTGVLRQHFNSEFRQLKSLSSILSEGLVELFLCGEIIF